jgi:hypothetical protein
MHRVFTVTSEQPTEYARDHGCAVFHAAASLQHVLNAYTIIMSYDPAKRKLNLRKHAIDLAECDPVFEGKTHDEEAYFRAFPQG